MSALDSDLIFSLFVIFVLLLGLGFFVAAAMYNIFGKRHSTFFIYPSVEEILSELEESDWMVSVCTEEGHWEEGYMNKIDRIELVQRITEVFHANKTKID